MKLVVLFLITASGIALREIKFSSVMSTVVTIIIGNFIIAQSLNQRQFRDPSEEIDTEYGDIILHSGTVRLRVATRYQFSPRHH